MVEALPVKETDRIVHVLYQLLHPDRSVGQSIVDGDAQIAL
jgi:hypothetical protein